MAFWMPQNTVLDVLRIAASHRVMEKHPRVHFIIFFKFSLFFFLFKQSPALKGWMKIA
jgi:hypothetical protein